MKFSKASLAAVALVALAPLANASAFTNGSFESSSFRGGFTTLGTGSSGLTGWTIDDGSVDLINTYWQAAAGNYSLDLSGSGPAKISQTFDTVSGQSYVVSFSLAGNPDDSDKIKILTAGIVSPVASTTYNFNAAGKSATNMGWASQSFSFVASGTSSTLFFSSGNNSAWGPALDNVTVTAVPEPETFAMLLAGLGLIGFVKRRKSEKSSA